MEDELFKSRLTEWNLIKGSIEPVGLVIAIPYVSYNSIHDMSQTRTSSIAVRQVVP